MASKQNIAQYPNGFTDGVVIRGVPVLNTYSGAVWWVDAAGAQIGDGKFNRPFATIDTAINHASAGDTILVKAGHTETITAAAGIDADVAGISIIGLGQGRRRPTISFTTATTADVDIDAANITISNMVFDFTGVASLAAPIDVNAADFTLQGCELIQSSATNQCLRAIVGETAADRMKIIGNKIFSTTAGAVSAINLVGTADGTEIVGNYIVGDFSTAAIENATSNVLTNLLIDGNYIRNDNAGDWAIELVSACTGAILNNAVATDAIATAVDWGACAAFNNVYFDTSDTDSNATAIPTAQTTGGMDLATLGDRLGTDADTDAISAVLTGAAGVATWPTAAAYGNAVNFAEVLGYIQDGVRKGSGTAMAANKSVADALGTDGTTITDSATSVLGVIGSNTGTTAFSSSSVVANVDGNVLERDEVSQVVAQPSKHHPNYFTVTADMTSATWNTVAAHEIATVTGMVRAQIIVEVTATVVTTGTNGTIALGFEGNTSAIFSATALDAALTGDVFSAVYGSAATTPASGADAQSALTHAIFDVVVVAGKDIGYTIATNAATTGTLTFHVWWTPLDSTGAVTAGAGGAL